MREPFLTRLVDWLRFHRFHDNWHKIRWISRLMCWMGRHDFEADDVEWDYVSLKCFYCEKMRASRLPSR